MKSKTSTKIILLICMIAVFASCTTKKENHYVIKFDEASYASDTTTKEIERTIGTTDISDTAAVRKMDASGSTMTTMSTGTSVTPTPVAFTSIQLLNGISVIGTTDISNESRYNKDSCYELSTTFDVSGNTVEVHTRASGTRAEKTYDLTKVKVYLIVKNGMVCVYIEKM